MGEANLFRLEASWKLHEKEASQPVGPAVGGGVLNGRREEGEVFQTKGTACGGL